MSARTELIERIQKLTGDIRDAERKGDMTTAKAKAMRQLNFRRALADLSDEDREDYWVRRGV